MKSRNRLVSTENQLMVAKGEEGGGYGQMAEGEWEVQASSHGMIKSWDEKYSTENSQWYC